MNWRAITGIENLMKLGLLSDPSKAVYALRQFGSSEPLIGAVRGKVYNPGNFVEYLVDYCGVKPDNIKRVIQLLSDIN